MKKSVTKVAAFAGIGALLFAGGCARQKSRACFDATTAANGASTRALFAARRCQGGGVTWAPLLQVLARRRGPGAPVPVEEPTPGWTGAVYTLNGALFSVDEEGDAARFCSSDAGLFAAVRAGYQRLNADAGALRQAMAEASALEMECLEADGRTPALPSFALPQPDPGVLSQTRASLDRVRKAVHDQPVWCFPGGQGPGLTGALRFSDDGRVTWTAAAGAKPIAGTWHAPPAASGDPRIEVVAGDVLAHFDVGESGRPGFDLIGETSTTRVELVPGDACVRGG